MFPESLKNCIYKIAEKLFVWFVKEEALGALMDMDMVLIRLSFFFF